MFWQKKQTKEIRSVACYVGEKSYSLAVLKNNEAVVLTQYREFNEDTVHLMGKKLVEDVEALQLVAASCTLILSPKQYQLILMDAPSVPDDEVLQALRWNLKGLSDYDLDDVAMDVFFVPIKSKEAEKKAVVALTPLSELEAKRLLFEAAFLDIKQAGIIEMALKNLLRHMQAKKAFKSKASVLVIGFCDGVYTLYLMYQDTLYLVRTLEATFSESEESDIKVPDIVFEIERSIEYCVHQLKLPAPENLFLTPGFPGFSVDFDDIENQFDLKACTIDLMDYFDISPALKSEEQIGVFYSIVGALAFNQDESAA